MGKPQGPAKDSGVTRCNGAGCKANASRFDFCEEHYEQFKFGLIKKTGEQVPDYEKKFGHYQAYKQRKGARKVA